MTLRTENEKSGEEEDIAYARLPMIGALDDLDRGVRPAGFGGYRQLMRDALPVRARQRQARGSAALRSARGNVRLRLR